MDGCTAGCEVGGILQEGSWFESSSDQSVRFIYPDPLFVSFYEKKKIHRNF